MTPIEDQELDRRLRESNPVPGPVADQESMHRIRARVEPLIEERHGRARRWSRPGRRGLLVPVGVGIAALALAGYLLLGGSPGGDGETSSAFAAAAIRVAEANSRLLVTEPGWEVVRADEFEPDSGETEFSDGNHRLQITWYPARYYDSYRRDRAAVPGPQIPIEVLGQPATMVHYGGTDFATMLPARGETFVEIRGNLGSEAAYRQILASLESVDVDTWLSAMPPSVVQPADRSATVDAMLQGVPIPPGFDIEGLREQDNLLDTYQLGATVTGAVSCEWLDRWVAAEKSGNDATAKTSVEAMRSSRQWPILQDMKDEGGWSQAVWDISRQLEQGDLNLGPAGTETLRNGKVYEFGPGYATALGCDSEYRRLRSEE